MMGFLVTENVDYRKYPKLLFQFQPLLSAKKKPSCKEDNQTHWLDKKKKYRQ